MWQLLGKIGLPQKIVRITQSFHKGTRAKVQVGNEFTDEYEVTTGLRQGCILAPYLFVLFFTYVPHYVSKDLPQNDGINIRH